MISRYTSSSSSHRKDNSSRRWWRVPIKNSTSCKLRSMSTRWQLRSSISIKRILFIEISNLRIYWSARMRKWSWLILGGRILRLIKTRGRPTAARLTIWRLRWSWRGICMIIELIFGVWECWSTSYARGPVLFLLSSAAKSRWPNRI